MIRYPTMPSILTWAGFTILILTEVQLCVFKSVYELFP